MPEFFSKGSINWYLENTILILLILVFAFIGQRSKRGIAPGTVITRMTLSSDKKWKQVNRFSAKLAYILFTPLLAIDIIFYIVDRQRVYAFKIAMVTAVVAFVYSIILMVYTDILERRWLAEQKKKGHPVSDLELAFPGIPKKRLITGTFVVGTIVVVLFILQFVLFRGY